MKYGNIILVRFILTVLGCFIGFFANASDDGTDLSFTHEKFVSSFYVNENGTYVLTTGHILLINDERAIKTIAQQSIVYNKSLQKVKLVEAYTLKPNGRRVMVRPDQIRDQQERQSADAPLFQDSRVKVIIFPEVAVGDRIIYTYKLFCMSPLYPGQFDDVTYGEFNPVKQMTMTYDMPENLPLHADNVGFYEIAPVVRAGRRIYQWDYLPGENHHLEIGSVAYVDYGRRLFVSTFSDYSSLARAYDKRANEKVVITAKIFGLARQITSDLTDPRAKASAIYNWVRKNIRYVAVFLGPGGVVPHLSEAILDNRYGDCKDHVTLMEALLKAVEIDSTPALINEGSAYKLPKVPATFNHVITYIPSLDLYLDSTSPSTSPNYLPDGDIDKQVLLTHGGIVAHTPMEQFNFIKNESVFKILQNGTMDFVQSQTFLGKGAEEMRYLFNNTKQADIDNIVKKLMSNRGKNGGGQTEIVDVGNPVDKIQIKFIGHEDDLVDLPGPTGLNVDSSLTNELRNNLTPITIEGNRTQDFICRSWEVEENARYDISENLEILSLPKSVYFKDDNFEYRSNYLMELHQIVVKRFLRFHHHGVVCKPSEYVAMSASLTKIIRDLRNQVIFQSTAH